ncbi:hypothetical protein EJB05_14052 [Eragrostis curvula]|uniref:Uncharacterized protein n=1 Tax=Eragrostis curvula TaxID=38414 RepID=A0A5J9VY77_9POAL|nr:hypothetical protein EJB05_14052 [Eragrostis curvula]
MALRVMARRVGIPAFRQASVPRVSPSAGSGPLASRSSQAGYSNNTKADAARKMRHAEISKSAEKEVEEEVAKVKASFKEAREAIKDARRREARYWKVVVGSGAAGFALAVYTCSSLARGVRNIAWGK